MRKHTFSQTISAPVAAGLTAGELESRTARIMSEVRQGKAKDTKSKRAPLIKSHSRSKYMPHQGARECARRRMGGFARKHGVIFNDAMTSLHRSSLAPLI